MPAPKRRVVRTEAAPRAVGPYSQAIRCGDLLFLSGQIPLDPVTGRLVEGSIELQARQALDNLGAVLTAGGSSFARVVKTSLFLTDLRDFAAVNAVYATYFPFDPPARSTIQVAALPLGACIEIEAIAVVP
jgi:2-iminobutanoate/2-iminopropanoate deaminase